MANLSSPAASRGRLAVLGAGVVGLCTALEAQRHGYAVTLIDRNPPGTGASFGNAGYLATELIDPLATPATLASAPAMWLDPNGPLSLPLRYLPRALPWLTRFIRAAAPAAVAHSRAALTALNRAAVPAWQRCLDDIGATEQLVRSGYLLVWESPDKLEAARAHARSLAQQGIPTELLQGEALAAKEPALAERLSHALFFPNACRVRDPYQLSLCLLAAFEARGGQLLRQEIRNITPQAGRIQLETADGASFHAEQAIICTGAWSKALLQQVGLTVPLEAERGYHLTIEADHLTLNHPIGSAERRFVMSPLDSGLRVVGITEIGGLSLPPLARGFAALRHHSSQLLRHLADPSLKISEWMGHRPTLPDSLPVIDRHPSHPRLLFAFGNQHLGLTQAAVSAELVVSLLRGQPPAIDPAPFRVDRF
ncbi:NAD(P)/FAD-dependent oxidoreductase [Photobacterium sp. TY1-4]|uniref:NAD(P)/FAD-dependent oxidoreductase n=1 Tax=Photobacterium sp. TY1-4 TaxID=2899122 RepID=UPI0021BF7894|nr:FAD-dependent oxidoreductase [Photobacterium sp. TY1-4]UXI01416.1 FAD-binding oxidoreductase [Photobacterium sp. TY1-4]